MNICLNNLNFSIFAEDAIFRPKPSKFRRFGRYLLEWGTRSAGLSNWLSRRSPWGPAKKKHLIDIFLIVHLVRIYRTKTHVNVIM